MPPVGWSVCAGSLTAIWQPLWNCSSLCISHPALHQPWGPEPRLSVKQGQDDGRLHEDSSDVAASVTFWGFHSSSRLYPSGRPVENCRSQQAEIEFSTACTFGRLIPHFSRQLPEKLPAAATVPHARPWASPLEGADSAQEGTLSSGDKQGAQTEGVSGGSPLSFLRKPRGLPVLLTIWLHRGFQGDRGECGCRKDTSGRAHTRLTSGCSPVL